MNLIQIPQKEGFSTIGPISTGQQAIETALKEKPDLILMDIYLRDGIDGITAVKIIHRDCKIPVIYVTASKEHETMARLGTTEYEEVVYKPYNNNQMARIISNYADADSGSFR